MAIILFTVLAGLEIGLCIAELKKQPEEKQRRKSRLVVRALQWGIIALLLLLPVGNKGLRFAGTFVILSIRLFIAGISFLCKPRSKKEANGKKAGRIVSTIFGCLMLLFSLIPAFVFTGYQGLPTTGAYEVGMVSAILTDESRLETFENDGSHREVPIYVYYPKNLKDGGAMTGNEEFPVVYFSHGAFGYYQSNSSTYVELASNGYVVISMDHPYHSFFTKDTDGKTILVDMEFIQTALVVGNAEDGEIPEEEIFETTRAWMNLRMADMRFVIGETLAQSDFLKKDNTPGQAWYVAKDSDAQKMALALSMIDAEKVGVMGHSLGGATSVTIGRQMRDVVDAVIDFDGTMLGEELAYENGAYVYPAEPYPVPLLSFNNEKHQKTMETYGTLYVNGAVLANARYGRYTYVKGTGHMNYTDLPLISPFLASKLGTGRVDAKKCIETMNEITLQFFDHYLKGTGKLQILESY
ncbi:MAG: hypothetical protein K5678_06450 [Acetatifactor sp.]|nr:hypothetical protein [Acetatifactor sp.]